MPTNGDHERLHLTTIRATWPGSKAGRKVFHARFGTAAADAAGKGTMMPFSWLFQFRKTITMTINFPNRSRSYDATQGGIRFWGYDQSMEANFLVTVDALRRIAPGVQAEAADLLSAFDLHRERIYAIAAKVYARGRRGSYALVAADV